MRTAAITPAKGQLRIVHVIARLNIGGTSIHVITLTKRLEELGYVATLVRGREEAQEGTMDDLAVELGVQPVLIPTLRRDPGLHDLAALIALMRLLRRLRPDIVHTHAAKAGSLGRIAAILVCPGWRRRAVRIHTFHGHSLTGYFSPRVANFYRMVERVLARFTDRLIAVSPEVRDDLVQLGVAPVEKFQIVPYGFDLSMFSPDAATHRERRASVRDEFGVAADALVVTLIARLVPIKRVDRFLNACVGLLDLENVLFLVVGDGELRDSLRDSREAQILGSRLIWVGFRRDIPDICFASDIVALSSDQEGTPISLIEAAAAGLPTVSTDVGGASLVVRNRDTGLLVERDDGTGLSLALRELLQDPALRQTMGAAAHRHAVQTFALDRLVGDMDGLYRRLLPDLRESDDTLVRLDPEKT